MGRLASNPYSATIASSPSLTAQYDSTPHASKLLSLPLTLREQEITCLYQSIASYLLGLSPTMSNTALQIAYYVDSPSEAGQAPYRGNKSPYSQDVLFGHRSTLYDCRSLIDMCSSRGMELPNWAQTAEARDFSFELTCINTSPTPGEQCRADENRRLSLLPPGITSPFEFASASVNVINAFMFIGARTPASMYLMAQTNGERWTFRVSSSRALMNDS